MIYLVLIICYLPMAISNNNNNILVFFLSGQGHSKTSWKIFHHFNQWKPQGVKQSEIISTPEYKTNHWCVKNTKNIFSFFLGKFYCWCFEWMVEVRILRAKVVQLGERRTSNSDIVGSNPTSGRDFRILTIHSKNQP